MNVYYSVPLNVLCDSNGNPLQAVPQLAYGDVPAVVFAALDADNEPVDLSSATKWELTVDVDRAVETPYLCEVLPDGFTYNATNKTLSYRLNSRTLEFFSAVNGKSQLGLIAELCGYDSSDTRLFRFPWNMIGVMPVDGGAAPDPDSVTGNYSAFEVYANAEAIPAGTEHADLGFITTAIPALMTETFEIRANYKHEDSDVIVDWGDGSTSVVRKGEFQSEDLSEWDKEHQYEAKYFMSHTYAVTGKYVVKIYGKRYFGLSHQWSQANNLICRCFDNDLPLASWVNNLAGFGTKAIRLVELCIPTAFDFRNIENFYCIFKDCINLRYAYGLKRKIKIVRSATFFFMNDAALIETDFVMPVTYMDASSEPQQCFFGCGALITPIQKLIPTAGFTNRIMTAKNLFNGCAALTGTVPAALLWNDTSIVWQNTSAAFTGASDAIRAQVPTSWGGTAAN